MRKIAEGIGRPVVIKAQVWATGRFKAGGIKFADTPEQAEEAARSLLGSEIKGLKVAATPSTDPKCSRCWVHDATVGHDSERPGICRRCLAALAEATS